LLFQINKRSKKIIDVTIMMLKVI